MSYWVLEETTPSAEGTGMTSSVVEAVKTISGEIMERTCYGEVAGMTGCTAATATTSWWAVRATTGYMGTRVMTGYMAGQVTTSTTGDVEKTTLTVGQGRKVGCEKFQDFP